MDMARVLIVEDETVLRASLAHGLSKTSGMEVRDAGSVDQALSLIDKGAPDIIISDIDLPGRTGIELLGELGKRGLSIPIVYVSAYLKAYGAQIPQHANIEVLEKPIALEELRRVINDKLAARDEDDTELDTGPARTEPAMGCALMDRNANFEPWEGAAPPQRPETTWIQHLHQNASF